MRFFRKKEDNVVDLTERYKRLQEKKQENQNVQENSKSCASPFGFFGAIAQTASENNSQSSEYLTISDNSEEKKRKLGKRLIDMTNKLEEISNQIYHLQQRVELLERKAGVGGF
jgi:hypothetical protein